MTITKKGLPNIRTLSGMVNQASSETYRAYLQLFCIEMEKFRRGKEKESAMQRVQNIDARFEAIDAEKAAILRALNLENNSKTNAARDTKSGASPGRGTEGFKVKY